MESEKIADLPKEVEIVEYMIEPLHLIAERDPGVELGEYRQEFNSLVGRAKRALRDLPVIDDMSPAPPSMNLDGLMTG